MNIFQWIGFILIAIGNISLCIAAIFVLKNPLMNAEKLYKKQNAYKMFTEDEWNDALVFMNIYTSHRYLIAGILGIIIMFIGRFIMPYDSVLIFGSLISFALIIWAITSSSRISKKKYGVNILSSYGI